MKCILLSRVSTEHQDLVQQTNELIAEAKRLGYTDWTIIEDKESAISLDESERQGLNKMKETIEAGGIDCVICYEVSRLSRRPKVLYSVRDYLIDRQIQLVVLKPYMRLLDNDGKMSQTASIMFSLFASLSESEMMIKQERMTRGKRQKQKEGGFIGGQVAYGYQVDNNKKIVIKEDEANIVRDIYKMYLKYKCISQVANHHIEIGTFGTASKSAVHQHISMILKRGFYAGLNPKKPYPPIVGVEEYNRAQEICEANKRSVVCSTNYYKKKSQALLNRLVWQGSRRYGISPSKCDYHFRNINRPQDDNCININILDSLVWYIIQSLNIVEHDIDETKKDITQKIKDNEARIKHFNIRIDELNKKIDKCEERIIMGKISDDKGEAIERQLKSEIEDLKLDMRFVENQNVNLRLELLQSDMILDKKDDIQTQQETVQKWVKKVEVDKVDTNNSKLYCCDITIMLNNGLSFKYRAYHNRPGYYRIYNKNNELIKFELLNYFKSQNL